MQPWNVLVEATIQGVTIQGTITAHSANEETAKKLACQTFIKNLRASGVWIRVDEVEEPYQVEGPIDKKTGKPAVTTKFRKVNQYVAPYWDHVKAVKILPLKERDFTYSSTELDDAQYGRNDTSSKPKPKRRTTGEVALATRKIKEASVEKKEKRAEQQKKAATNKQSKADLLKVTEKYFTGGEAKIIKDATGDLEQTYQRLRYALFQIRDKGYNGAEYELEQTKIDGSAAFKLVKKG